MNIITATDLPRFMNCNGSRLMTNFISDVKNTNEVREEGNAVHWLIEQTSKKMFEVEELIDRKAPNGVFINSDMVEHIEPFMNGEGKDGEIEKITSFSGNTWKIESRADRIKFDGSTLFVDDFKYGWGLIEPEENWTLIAHALGVILNSDGKCLPKNIKFTIYQPRPYHMKGAIRSWSISYDQLDLYYHKIAETLSNPNNLLNTGQHCYKCPAMVHCGAFVKAAMNGIEASENAYNDNINNDDLTFMLDQLKRAGKVLEQAHEAYSELALHRIKKGEIVKNYSIDNDLSRKTWNDNTSSETLRIITGKDLTKNQLITPEQAIKAGVDENIVNSFSSRKTKGIKLVRIDENDKAKKLFKKD